MRKRAEDEKAAFEAKFGCTKFCARQNHQHRLEAEANAQTLWSNGGNRVQSQRSESFHRQQWAGQDPALTSKALNPFPLEEDEQQYVDIEARELAARNNQLRRTLHVSQSAAPRYEA